MERYGAYRRKPVMFVLGTMAYLAAQADMARSRSNQAVIRRDAGETGLEDRIAFLGLVQDGLWNVLEYSHTLTHAPWPLRERTLLARAKAEVRRMRDSEVETAGVIDHGDAVAQYDAALAFLETEPKSTAFIRMTPSEGASTGDTW